MNLFDGFRQARQAVREEAPAHDDAAAELSPLAGNSMNDERFMARALKLAGRGIYTTHPNPMVGCVIVKNDTIIGEGWHQYAGKDHAEIMALEQASRAAQGATLYVTLEPCSHHGKTPPCVNAIVKAGIARVVAAMEDPNPLVNRSGIAELRRCGISVLVGTGQSQAKQLNHGFLKRITTGMPWVTLKIATSLDGKTAMSSGESQWITSPAARLDGQKARAASSAVLTGVGTVLRDDPSMNVRLENVSRQPCRIVLDTNLSMPVDSRIIAADGPVLIVTASQDEEVIETFAKSRAEIIYCGQGHGNHGGGAIDLNMVMQELGRREMNTVLLEAGSRLSGSMLQQGLVDRIIVYMAPDLLGAEARDMFLMAGLEQLSDRVKLEYRDMVMVGRDLKITLDVV